MEDIENNLLKLKNLGCSSSHLAVGSDKLYFQKIGNVMVLFQDIENVLKENITVRLYVKDGNEIKGIIEELSFKGLVRSLNYTVTNSNEMYNYSDPLIFEEKFNELIKQAYKVEELRNRFTHSLWERGSSNDSATSIKSKNYKGSFNTSIKEIKMNDFDLVIEWMNTVYSGFKDFWYQYGGVIKNNN